MKLPLYLVLQAKATCLRYTGVSAEYDERWYNSKAKNKNSKISHGQFNVKEDDISLTSLIAHETKIYRN